MYRVATIKSVAVMEDYLQILLFVVLGFILLCFIYGIVMDQWARIRRRAGAKPGKSRKAGKEKKEGEEAAGKPKGVKTCPVCSTVLKNGELIETRAYPSLTGGRERLIHIQGCVFCMKKGGRERKCPVCGAVLTPDEKLVARMFENPVKGQHVHILGCFKCRKAK
jgi:hypothetical protein